MQFWVFSVDTQQLRHGSSDKCLAISDNKKKVLMEECNVAKEQQKWKLENYDPSKAKWNFVGRRTFFKY